MKIDNQHLKTILKFLLDAYPFPIENFDPIISQVGGEKEMIGHLVYLYDKGFIEGDFEFKGYDASKPWDIKIYSIRINSEGIDHYNNITTFRAPAIR